MLDAFLLACAGLIGVGLVLEDGGYTSVLTLAERRRLSILFYLCLALLLWRNL